MENLGKSFSFMFEDKEWLQKILIGGLFTLLSMVLIGIPFLLGYLLILAKQSAEGRPVPLPAWDNLGDKFISGLVYFLILVIYIIPIAIIDFILMFIPCLGWLAAIFLAIIFGIIMPYIAIRYVRSGKFADAFDFGAIIDFTKKNFANLLIVWLMSILFGIIAWFGVLALFVGFLFTYFWAQLAVFYLYGQVIREAEKRDQAPAVSGGAAGV